MLTAKDIVSYLQQWTFLLYLVRFLRQFMFSVFNFSRILSVCSGFPLSPLYPMSVSSVEIVIFWRII